jgi:hypothetical protein
MTRYGVGELIVLHASDEQWSFQNDVALRIWCVNKQIGSNSYIVEPQLASHVTVDHRKRCCVVDWSVFPVDQHYPVK